MSSVNGLLVPNNFDIYAKSINTPGGGVSTPARELYSGADTNVINVGDATTPSADQALIATGPNTATWQDVVTPANPTALSNKTMVDGSNTVSAANLFSNNKTNTIDVASSASPLVGQVLTATGTSTATWQTPTGGAYRQEGFSTIIPLGTGEVPYQSGALPDGIYGCSAIVAVSPPNALGISSYRCTATVWITGGVASLRGNGISDNQGGVGAGTIASNPLFSVSGQQIIITAGDSGSGNMSVSGVVTLVRTA